MTPETVAWLEGLRETAANAARGHTSPTVPQEHWNAERAILAAHLVRWIDTELPGLSAERAAAAGLSGGDPEPALVLTTSAAGAAAADEVLGRADPWLAELRARFAIVTEREYRLWCIRHPDPEYRLHANHWSWIKTNVPAQRRAGFARWPLRAEEVPWLHRTGTVGLGRPRRQCHLWKFDGRTASLVQPFIDEDVAGLSGPSRGDEGGE
jgi:hypothetical protein